VVRPPQASASFLPAQARACPIPPLHQLSTINALADSPLRGTECREMSLESAGETGPQSGVQMKLSWLRRACRRFAMARASGAARDSRSLCPRAPSPIPAPWRNRLLAAPSRRGRGKSHQNTNRNEWKRSRGPRFTKSPRHLGTRNSTTSWHFN